MKKLKNQKGITLVALIITIIILLILAVVALREITGDGIIAKAKEARTNFETEQRRENTTLEEYEREITDLNLSEGEMEYGEKEKVNIATKNALAKGNGIVEKEYLTEELNNEFGLNNWEYIEEEESCFKINIKTTRNKYIIDPKGTVELYKGISLDKKNIELELKPGEIITETIEATLENIEGNIEWSIANEDVATLTIEEKVIVTAISSGKTTLTVICGEYSASCEIIVKTRIGKKVEYDGKEWTILYDDETYGLQMITNNSYGGTVTFGKLYEDLSKQSYNSAINTLNTKCDEIVADSSKILYVRSVGSDPKNKDSETTTRFSFTNYSGSWKNIDDVNGWLKDTDKNYEKDLARMDELKITYSPKINNYWLASRNVYVSSMFGNPSNIDFAIRYIVGNTGDLKSQGVITSNKSSGIDWHADSGYGHYLRPVAVLNPNVQFIDNDGDGLLEINDQ